MAIIILLLCLITIFYTRGVQSNSTTTLKELIIQSVVIFSGFVVLITEVCSFFKCLNFQSILLSWIIITVANLIYLYFNKLEVKLFYNYIKQKLTKMYQSLKALKRYEKWLFFSVLIIVVLIFLQGIIYPPNNWDSMNYHLASVNSWIAHQTVAHYPTHFPPQIYQPPFAEFVAMHFNILTRADYFSGAVQFSFLIFTVIASVAIIENFEFNISYKILAVFLTLTIPEAILQATSTQNDVVVAFFVVVAFYFAIKSIKEFSLKNAFFFGLAVGLGILTKATAYIYMPAILLIFGITMLFRLASVKNYKPLLFGLLAGLMFLMVNLGFYTRNYQLTKSVLGVDNHEYGSYSNEKMNAKLFFFSMLKNAGVHIGLYHLKPLSVFAANSIIKLHQLANVDVDDPATNFFADKYATLYNPDHEDAAPNFIHLLLTTASLIVITLQGFKKKIPLNVKLLAFTVVFQFSFFCLYLKYQPFHTRLHTSMFLLSVPLICYAFSLLKVSIKNLFYLSTPFIFIYALMVVLGNLNTPYNTKIKLNRYEKYFISKPFLYDEYTKINNTINTNGYQKIGMITGTESWDYSFFTNCYAKPITPVYINVTNYTKIAAGFNTKVDCVISTVNNNPYIDYQGKRFYNQNPKNQFIHLYK